MIWNEKSQINLLNMQIIKSFLQIQRAAMMLLTTLFALFIQTAKADSWPEYITDVVLAGGTASEVASVKSSSTYSGYTWCSKSLNDGTSGDIIYIGYPFIAKDTLITFAPPLVVIILRMSIKET